MPYLTLLRRPPCLAQAILLLVQRVQPVLSLPGEVVLHEGQPGIGLFFIVNGHIRICKGEEQEVLSSMK